MSKLLARAEVREMQLNPTAHFFVPWPAALATLDAAMNALRLSEKARKDAERRLIEAGLHAEVIKQFARKPGTVRGKAELIVEAALAPQDAARAADAAVAKLPDDWMGDDD
jgi:hypothetical protein